MLTATFVEVSPRELITICFVFVAGFIVFFYNRFTVLGGVVFIVLAGIVAWFMYRKSQGMSELIYTALGDIVGIVKALQGDDAFTNVHEVFLVYGITLLISAFIVINIGKVFNIIMPGLVGAAVMFIPASFGFAKSELALFVFLLCFIILLLKRLNKTVLPKGNFAIDMLSIPLCFVVLLVAYNMPKPQATKTGIINESTMKQATQAVGEATNILVKPHEVPVSQNGKKLGGTITMGDEVVMEVQSDYPVYLAGEIYDTYTGSAWRTRHSEKEDVAVYGGEYSLEFSGEDLREEQRNVNSNYGQGLSTVTITTKLRTSMIFSPPSRLSFASENDLALGLRLSTHGVLNAVDNLAVEYKYTQQYLAWDYNSHGFQSYLKQANSSGVDVFGLPEIEACLELPELPKRLITMTNEVTANIDNDYDKIKAIEEFLAAFPYTLETSEVPAGRDFVDYFVFDEQRGYCVYYATALAVMGRLSGIPTRYVEGYVTPLERNGMGNFTVTGKQAHAWTEVFFDGFGWVRFEPTSSYFAETYSQAAPQPEILPETFENIKDEPKEDPEKIDDTPLNEDNDKGFPIWIAVLISSVVLVGLGGFIAYKKIKNNKNYWKKLENEPNKEAVIEYYTYILKAKKYLGLEIKQGETASSFAKRIVGDSQGDREFEDITSIFLNAAYSQTDTTDPQKEQVKSYYYSLLDDVRTSYKVKPIYFIDRYLRMKY